MTPEADLEPTDRALLQAHLDGDREAFGTLFARHRDRLWAVALRTTGDREEAADALQEAMISAFRRAASYRGDAAVTTWLHRIVVNAALDRLRRRKVRLADPLPDDEEEYADRGSLGTAAPDDPLEEILVAERREAVLSALNTLPPDQKAALVLVDLQGCSIDEAAAILECPSGTVKSRCSRGRGRLAPLLAAYRRNPDPPPRVPSEDREPSSARDDPPRPAPEPRPTEEVTSDPP